MTAPAAGIHAGPRFYSARLARGAVKVGVSVFFGPPLVDGDELDRSPRWQARIGDAATALALNHFADDGRPVDVDGATLRDCAAITEAEHRYLVAHGAWAVANAPEHPRAAPRKAADLRGMRGLF